MLGDRGFDQTPLYACASVFLILFLIVLFILIHSQIGLVSQLA